MVHSCGHCSIACGTMWGFPTWGTANSWAFFIQQRGTITLKMGLGHTCQSHPMYHTESYLSHWVTILRYGFVIWLSYVHEIYKNHIIIHLCFIYIYIHIHIHIHKPKPHVQIFPMTQGYNLRCLPPLAQIDMEHHHLRLGKVVHISWWWLVLFSLS